MSASLPDTYPGWPGRQAPCGQAGAVCESEVDLYAGGISMRCGDAYVVRQWLKRGLLCTFWAGEDSMKESTFQAGQFVALSAVLIISNLHLDVSEAYVI